MSEEQDYIRVYTGSDFLASLLKVELDDAGISVKMRSDKDAGLHSGFASSGFAQVLVDKDHLEKATSITKAFEEKMK